MTVKFKSGRALGAVSITPLIDVVFLLLIFFLVATRFAQEERELDVSLPSASDAAPMIEEPRVVMVNIDRDGRTYIDGQFLSVDEVERLLRRAKTNNPLNQSVTIRADRRVAFEHVSTVMNLCSKVGIRDYRFATAGEDATE